MHHLNPKPGGPGGTILIQQEQSLSENTRVSQHVCSEDEVNDKRIKLVTVGRVPSSLCIDKWEVPSGGGTILALRKYNGSLKM